MTIVVPAILAKTQEEFFTKVNNSELRSIAPLWQIDVLDGSMFDHVSWFDAREVAKINDLPEIELHLMISNPLPIIEAWKKQVPTLKRAIIHAEIDRPVGAIVHRIHDLGLEAGLAINPETPIKLILDHLDEIQILLVMGVHPGASGRQFGGESIIQKIKEIKNRFPELKIGVDGGINLANASEIVTAGTDQLCVSSALWETPDPKNVYQKLASL